MARDLRGVARDLRGVAREARVAPEALCSQLRDLRQAQPRFPGVAQPQVLLDLQKHPPRMHPQMVRGGQILPVGMLVVLVGTPEMETLMVKAL